MQNKLKDLRKQILELAHLGGDSNLQSIFSCLDIMYILHNGIMNDDDIFVLSKGQANLGLAVILADKGLIDKDELKTYCQFDSRISMQLDRTKFGNEVKISSGSLGHGLPMAVGIAMAKKIKDEDGIVYCLVGDGEFNEGTMWESLLLASSKKLNNLCVIIDDNNSIGKMIDNSNLAEKLLKFGFCTFECDGYDHNTFDYATSITKHLKCPFAIILEAKRGYGCETIMSDNSWFHRSPDKLELEILKREVDEFENSNV